MTSTVLIALISVIVLGVPLTLLARREVMSSAQDKLDQDAQIVAAGLEDRLDAAQSIDAQLLARLLPERRVLVTTARGQRVTSGPSVHGDVLRASTALAGATITVEESQTSASADARNITLLVAGFGLLAVAAAAALALRQARQLASPLSELVERAESLGRGDFSRAVFAAGIPEIDEIAAVLERSAHQVGGLIAMQRDFAADAAHQLRTPLTGVGLRLEEISYLGSDEVRAEADAALSQVSRLELVITELLARARGDSAPRERVDVAELVRDECATWDRVISVGHRRLQLDLAGPSVVVARRGHLASILSTLLDNALHHGAGTITVAVRLRNHGIDLTVTDQGPGIAIDLRERVFDRSVSSNRGTGIGLALARSLAEAEGARLFVAPAGNQFVLRLGAGVSSTHDDPP